MHFTVIVLLFLTNVLGDDSVVDEMPTIARLRKKLLTGYQRSARPVKNHKTQTNVTISISFLITDVDVTRMTMNTANYLVLEWKDEHLIWNPLDYNGMSDIVLSQRDIWTPDIRSFDFTHRWDSDLETAYINVSSNGEVNWYPTCMWKFHCRIDLKDYPFDTQVCTIMIASWTYDSRGLKLQWKKFKDDEYMDSVEDHWNKVNPRWNVVSIDGVVEKNNETSENVYDVLSARITIKRRNESYFYPVMLPFWCTSLLGILSFLESVGSLKRICLAASSMTLSFVILTNLSIELGGHSLSIPYGIKCCGISIIMMSVGTFVPLLLLKYSRSLPSLPKGIVNILTNPLIIRVCCLPHRIDSNRSLLNDPENHGQNEEHLDYRQTEDKQAMSRNWMSLVAFVDSLCFLAFLILSSIYHM